MTSTCKSLIVRNLATNVTVDNLKSIFNLISLVDSVQIIEDVSSFFPTFCTTHRDGFHQ